jgi:hypothetical protein
LQIDAKCLQKEGMITRCSFHKYLVLRLVSAPKVEYLSNNATKSGLFTIKIRLNTDRNPSNLPHIAQVND